MPKGKERGTTCAPGQPEEVATAFAFFASETDSSYINGEILTLLGGETRTG
jgi:NAD(P)-dependent dehydrogenase (short-subunit alcohol dehydrogenase family)